MNKRSLTAALTVLILIVLAVGGYLAAVKSGKLSVGNGTLMKDSGDNISDYTAVFLTNGQVYFGKEYANDKGVDLRDIYYLQVNQTLQPTDGKPSANPSPSSTANPNVVLVKLGEELHGPNDRMLINKNQVLFTESLKKSSKVIDAISNYKK